MPNSDAFVSIDSTELATVTGGYSIEGEGSLNLGGGASAGGVNAAINGKYKYAQSNYESCVDAMKNRPGWTPAEMKDTCGLPPSSS